VHLAVFAEERAVGIENRAGIVIDAGSASFEERNNQGDFLFFGDLGEFFGRGAGNCFREIKSSGSSVRQKYSP